MSGRCNKISYDTREQAATDSIQIQMNARNRRNHMSVSRMHPYECPICALWHLTAQSRSRDKKIKKRVRRLRAN